MKKIFDLLMDFFNLITERIMEILTIEDKISFVIALLTLLSFLIAPITKLIQRILL